MEPSGFSQEAIDYVRGMSAHFYVGIQMEGSRIDGYMKSWSPELREMIDRYHAREQYILARPHTLIHHGAAGDFFCDDKPERPMYCIGRAMFETDRVPFMWVDNLQTQHQIWVPSDFNVRTFTRCGLDRATIKVVPEPMNTTLFNPQETTPLHLPTGKRYHFLAVYAWNDRKGWDRLLKAYWAEFTAKEDVCLVLRTFPKHRNDANFDPEASGEWVHMKLSGAAREWFHKDTKELACVHVIATHLSERDLPRLYKAASAFALPSRGEGWGRPIVEAMAMGLPTVVTGWGAPTDFTNSSNSWPVPLEGLSCVNSEPRRGNPAGVYAGHRWAEASIPALRQILRHLFVGDDPQIALRAAAARRTVVPSYGYAAVNTIVEDRLATVPDKYKHDPHELLRELYEDLLRRPPSDTEINFADAHYSGWQHGGKEWHSLLCALCLSRDFLERWEASTMPSCAKCGAPLEKALAPYKEESQICSNEGVDVVYTFASDSDSSYRDERTRMYKTLWMTQKLEIDTSDAVAVQRARGSLVEWLFRMSLRSLDKHVPWVRNVYVVTDTPPAWLQRTNVRLIRTSEIMPSEHLPTFNSHAIEVNLHKIAGLGECYLYLNSDYLFGQPTSIDTFVDRRKGQYKMYIETDRTTMSSSSLTRGPASHDAAFRNANVLLDRWHTSNGPVPTRHFVPHAPHFFRRSVVEELARKASAEFQATSSHRFRSFQDIHVAYLHAYYLKENPERFLVRTIDSTEMEPALHKPTYTIYLFNKPGQPLSFYHEINTLRAAVQSDSLPPFFSINDAMDDAGSTSIVTFVRDSLLAVFPQSSKYEQVHDLPTMGLPNTSLSAICTSSAVPFNSDKRAAGCPAMWEPHSICTSQQSHSPCDYQMDRRPLRCVCCYPERLTWQCGFADDGPSLEREADNVVNPSEYIVKTAWRGRAQTGVDSERPFLWSGVLQINTTDFERQWGRCHSDGAVDVLVLLPFDEIVPCPVRERMFESLRALECANPGFNVHLGLSDDWEPDLPQDLSRRAAIARLRNRLLKQYLKPSHKYVLWLDGGVVRYPPDLIVKLHRANPNGITAPLVLLEESDQSYFHQRHCGSANCAGSVMGARPKKFHDPRGFLLSGQRLHGADQQFPGTVGEWPPYLGAQAGKVDCESVGTTYLAPAEVYRSPKIPKFFATPFTENFPVVHAAKYELNMRVLVDLDTVVEHALLLRYGVATVANYNRQFDDSGSQWAKWLAPYHGKLLSDPSLRHTSDPSR